MKKVVITGVSQGLGKSMALYFAKSGFVVHGCGRNAKALEDLSVQLPAPHVFRVVDVSNDAEVAAWSSNVFEDGAPDMLINNAAVIARPAALWKLSSGEVDSVIDVNIKGTIHVIRHFVPAMINQGRGVIVNFSSGWGRSTSPDVATYCASKYAIEGLTASLAQELPTGLAAVSLNPGIIHTKMLKTCFGDSASEYPSPEEWIISAGPFLKNLSSRHNGMALTVPGIPT